MRLPRAFNNASRKSRFSFSSTESELDGGGVFNGPPAADSLMARIIPNPSTAVAEFESGGVDVLYIPEADTRTWEQTDDRKALLQSAPALRLWYAGINTTRGSLADPRVRRAINHAVDSKTILRQLVGGRGRLAGQRLIPTVRPVRWPTRGPVPDTPAAAQPEGGPGHGN